MGTIRLLVTLALGVALAGRPLAQAPVQRQPIIDMHLHAYRAADWKGSPPNPITGKPGPATAEEHMRQTLAAMERYNVVKAIVSGPVEVVEQWRTAAPGRILASPLFGRPNVDLSGRPLPQIDELRSLFKSGRLSAIGEVVAQYQGLSPSDPALEPYFALAEELDIPVGIHTGTSFPVLPTRDIRASVSAWAIRCSSKICWSAIRSSVSSSPTAESPGVVRPSR